MQLRSANAAIATAAKAASAPMPNDHSCSHRLGVAHRAKIVGRIRGMRMHSNATAVSPAAGHALYPLTSMKPFLIHIRRFVRRDAGGRLRADVAVAVALEVVVGEAETVGEGGVGVGVDVVRDTVGGTVGVAAVVGKRSVHSSLT